MRDTILAFSAGPPQQGAYSCVDSLSHLTIGHTSFLTPSRDISNKEGGGDLVRFARLTLVGLPSVGVASRLADSSQSDD